MISRSQHRQTLILSAAIVIGLVAMVLMARWLDQRRPIIDSKIQQETLYLTGNTVRRMSLGFNGLVADWYWMRALQYVGRKVLDAPEHVQLDNLAQLDLQATRAATGCRHHARSGVHGALPIRGGSVARD